MALPSAYNDAFQYLSSSLEFLRIYSWIYKYSNTAFLKCNVLQHFPDEFKDYFYKISNENLNTFPLLNIDEKNKSEDNKIQEFRSKLKSLIPMEAFESAPNEGTPSIYCKHFRKINLKKQHEIVHLAQLVANLCGDIDLLIDFGAGHGYLSEMLCHLTENAYIILGLESDAERVNGAEKRCLEYLPKASNRVIYKQQFISETSLPLVTETAKEHCTMHGIEEPKIAIVGLHACADLTITAMKYFFNMGPELRRLIIMPCCYHKMEMTSTTTFRNFPLSNILKNILQSDPNYSNYLNRPFLRLACQQTLARWQNTSLEEHKKHGMEMFQRGIAEAIIDESTEYVEKRKVFTRETKNFYSDNSFKGLCQVYEIKSKKTNESLNWQEYHEKRFNDINSKYPDGYKLAEGLTCLQTSMQKLCENIVLFDRLCYMQEFATTQNLEVSVRYQKLLNEKLSPRCYALIAEKL